MNKYYDKYMKLKSKHHSKCMYNNVNGNIGNYLEISFTDKGVLLGSFNCSDAFQGYDGILHGGMTSSLIDASMAKCLMGHGVLGYTSRLDIRFVKPIAINAPLSIRCTITESYKELYKMKAELTQNKCNEKKVTAKANFYKIN
jgi:acyl-coenzyme A thioesterase PaaI-like protein